MRTTWLVSLILVALAAPVTAHAQVFEIIKELGVPQHYYIDVPPVYTWAGDAVPFPAGPDFPFAFSYFSTVRLRLVAPLGKKYVVTQPVFLSLSGDLNLVPVGSGTSGALSECPASMSINVRAGTPPTSTIQGFKTTADWLKLRATRTSASSANFEFTEIIIECDVSAFSGDIQWYSITSGGGSFGFPEITFSRELAAGTPDPGPAIFLEDIAEPGVLEITRVLGEPLHSYLNAPPVYTSANDAVPFPTAPNFRFAISDYNTVRLRLLAPAGKKYIVTRPVFITWPGLSLLPIDSFDSGVVSACPASMSINVRAGTAPTSTIQGSTTAADWLTLDATPTSSSSANFEFNEIVLECDVSAASGSSHMYSFYGTGGLSDEPEIAFTYGQLAVGAPDPGQAIFLQDIGGASDVDAEIPRTQRLLANVPNPFNPSTTIYFEVPSESSVQLDVLDVRGRLVRSLLSGRVEAGRHGVEWQGMGDDGRRAASGVYFYRLRSDSYVETRRMTLLK